MASEGAADGLEIGGTQDSSRSEAILAALISDERCSSLFGCSSETSEITKNGAPSPPSHSTTRKALSLNLSHSEQFQDTTPPPPPGRIVVENPLKVWSNSKELPNLFTSLMVETASLGEPVSEDVHVTISEGTEPVSSKPSDQSCSQPGNTEAVCMSLSKPMTKVSALKMAETRANRPTTLTTSTTPWQSPTVQHKKQILESLPVVEIVEQMVTLMTKQNCSWLEMERHLSTCNFPKEKRQIILRRVRRRLTEEKRKKDEKKQRKEVEKKEQEVMHQSSNKEGFSKFLSDSKPTVLLDKHLNEVDKADADNIVTEFTKLDTEGITFLDKDFKLIKSKVLGGNNKNKESYIIANESGLALPFQIVNMNTLLPQHINSETLKIMKCDLDTLALEQPTQRQRKNLRTYLYPTGERSAKMHAEYSHKSAITKMNAYNKLLSHTNFLIQDSVKDLMACTKYLNEVEVPEYYSVPPAFEEYLDLKITPKLAETLMAKVKENLYQLSGFMISKMMTLFLSHIRKSRYLLPYPLILLPSIKNLDSYNSLGEWISFRDNYQFMSAVPKDNPLYADFQEALDQNFIGRNDALQELAKLHMTNGLKLVWYEFFIDRATEDWERPLSGSESDLSESENKKPQRPLLEKSVLIATIEIPRYVQALRHFVDDIKLNAASKFNDSLKLWTKQVIEHEAFSLNVGALPRVIDMEGETLHSIVSQNCTVRPDLIRYQDDLSDSDVDLAEDKYHVQENSGSASVLKPTRVRATGKNVP